MVPRRRRRRRGRRSRGRHFDAARPPGHRRLDAARSPDRRRLPGPARSTGRDERPARSPGGRGPGRRPDRRSRQSVPDPSAGQVLSRAGQAVGQQVRRPQEREKMAALGRRGSRPIFGGSQGRFHLIFI